MAMNYFPTLSVNDDTLGALCAIHEFIRSISPCLTPSLVHSFGDQVHLRVRDTHEHIAVHVYITDDFHALITIEGSSDRLDGIRGYITWPKIDLADPKSFEKIVEKVNEFHMVAKLDDVSLISALVPFVGDKNVSRRCQTSTSP